MFVHVTFKCTSGCTSERVEIFSVMSILIVSVHQTRRKDRYCRLTVSVSSVNDRCWTRRRNVSRRDEWHDPAGRCSYRKVVNDDAISVDLDHVLELRVINHGHRVDQCIGKLQDESHISLFSETEVIVLTQIWRQVERIQCVTARKVLFIKCITFVSKHLPLNSVLNPLTYNECSKSVFRGFTPCRCCPS